MTTEQIKIERASFKYPGGEHPVLHDVSLTIEKGDFVAIIGGNGSGKSTLCKLINGLIPHYYVGDFSGQVTVNRSEEHTSELQSRGHLVCRLLLEKKKYK